MIVRAVFSDRWLATINSDNKLPRVHYNKVSIWAPCKLLDMEAFGLPVTIVPPLMREDDNKRQPESHLYWAEEPRMDRCQELSRLVPGGSEG